MTELTTRTARISLGEDGIVRADLVAGVEHLLTDAQENIRVAAELSAGRRRPVRIDFRQVKAMERKAREYYAGPETGKVVAAAAVVVGSPLSRVLGNFFMGLNKPGFPARLFDSDDAAIAWLRGYL